MAKNLKRLNPPSLPDAGAMGYTQVVTCDPGRMVFVSGQVAWSADGSPTQPSLQEQAVLVARNVNSALVAAGATPEDVVSVRAYVVDLDPEKAAIAFQPLLGLFNGRAPAVTAVGVTSLAAPDLLLEIELIAVV